MTSQPGSGPTAPIPQSSFPPVYAPPPGWRLEVVRPRTPIWRKPAFWVVAVFAALLAIGVTSCATQMGQALGVGGSVMSASHGEITDFRYNEVNGIGGYVFVAARGLDVADGPRLACASVRPVLAASGQTSVRFVIVNRAGDVIANENTLCRDTSPA